MKLSSFVMLSSRDAKLSSWAAVELSLVVVAVELIAILVVAIEVIVVLVATTQVVAVLVAATEVLNVFLTKFNVPLVP
jgi:hypothetical protein